MAGIPDPFFEMTRQMVAEASCLKNILKELPALAQKLSQYESWATVSKLAGLLTCPDCHANTIRIEGLIHLAIALCKGDEIPRRNDVYIWFNRHAANSKLCRMEDPLEDVFISNVINGNGNHRIFEGIWECNDYWLQCLLRTFVAMPQDADYEAMIRNVEALLRISEEIAKRNELKRYCSGGGEAKGEVFIPNPDDLDKYAANVIFSLADLEDIEVRGEDLLPFIWKDEEKSSIIESQLENSPLERRPLLFQGGRYLVALPTSISIAIRRYILEVVESKGDLKELEHHIFHVQTDQMTDFALSRLGARPWKPELFPQVKRKIGINLTYVPFQFDSDKFGLACYIAPPLANTEGTGFANLQQVFREWNEINELIGEAIKCVSAEKAFKEGLLLIAIGGLGAAVSFPAPKIPVGWNMVSYSVPNLLTLASLPDVNISMLWRLARQEQRFMEKGVELLNPNGDFNLFAAWKASEYDLLPDEAPLTDAPILLAPDINALLESRQKSRIRRDVHAVYRNSPPRWAEVERKNGFASFGDSRDEPFYVSGALARQGQLAGVVEVRDLCWWMVSHQKYSSEMQRSIVYQVWDCFCNWLIPIVKYLDQKFWPMHRTIETQLQFENLSQWGNGGKINGQGLDIPLEWKIEGHVGIITITEPFFRSFAQSQNTAERQIVSALLQYGAVFLGRSINRDELLAARDRIIPLGDARCFHVLAVNDATLSAVEGPSDPYFIKKEVLAEVLQELGFAVAPNSRGTLVNDKKDVRKLVRDAVAHLKQEIINSLKPLNLKIVVQRCLDVIDSIHRNHHTWKISAAALIALTNDKEELFGEAQRLESERSGANIAARALIEMALYSCSGEESPSDVLMDEILARTQQLIRIADYDQAIRADFPHGQISIARSGAFRIQNPYLDHVRYSYTSSEFKVGFSAASKTYAKWHEKEKKESAGLEDQELFDAACQSEFDLDALGMIEVSEALNQYAGNQSVSMFLMRREELISLLSSQISISHEQAGIFLERLRIYPREAWDADLPAGCDLSDVYPWKFKRRFSLLRRPFIQIDKAENPEFLVSPLLVRQAIRYLIETSYEGEFSQEFFQTDLMRRFWDHAVKRRSGSFVKSVSKKLESFGFQTRIDTKMSILGAPSKFGDIDVLAWKTEPTTQVLILECKALRNARSTSEILSQLNEFEGDTDDKLAKHLARVQWLTDNLPVLQSFLGLQMSAFKAWVVTSHTVPMQFVPRDMDKRSHFISYNSLEDHIS